MTIQAGQIITIGTAKFIIDDIRDGNRVGDIALRYTLRDGFTKLNGATVLREDYPRLVQWVEDNNLWTENEAELGLFGVSDGVTTIRLPDFRNRFIEGVDSNGGAVVGAGLPNITGSLGNLLAIIGHDAPGLAFISSSNDMWWVQGKTNGGTSQLNINFNAALSSNIYGNSTTVQPNSIRLIAQIKY